MSTRYAAPFGLFGATLARAAAVVVALKSAWERRRVVGQLSALDDHMLRDIGITRQDVLSVLAEPLFADPSVRLAERANEARLASRAIARDNRQLRAGLDEASPKSGGFAIDRRAA